jgi:hypothetical protein
MRTRTLLATLLAATIGAGTPSSAQAAEFRPCKYEDGSGQKGPCVWDARHMGNGSGRSYIVWSEDEYERVSHRLAHQLLNG